jgi:hypothetical protein
MANFNVGDTIKDTNPRCTHYGAIGKVVKINGGGTTTFVVSNKGDTYDKGDKLTKTNNQLKKEAEDKSPYVKIKALPDGKPMVVQTPMDSLMHSVLSDTTRIKRNQAVLDSIRSGKLDPKVYNDRIKGKPLKSTSILKAQALKKEGAFEKDGIAISAGIALAAAGVYGVGKIVSKIFRKKPGQIMNQVKAKEFKRLGKNTRSVGVNIPKIANVKQMGSLVDTGLSAEAAAKAAYPNATPEELAGHVVAYKAKKKRGKLYVDKVVLKKAELLQKAASKVNFSKVSNAALGYSGALPGVGAAVAAAGAGAVAGAATAYAGGTKQPGQVGSVPPSTSPTGGGGNKI